MSYDYWEQLKPWKEPDNSINSFYADLSDSSDDRLSRDEVNDAKQTWLELLKDYSDEALLLLIEDNQNPESVVGSASREELDRRSTLIARKAIRAEVRKAMDSCTPKQKAKYKARKSKKSK